MAALTTPRRVRDRMGFTTADLTDQILDDFIADQQAFVETNVKRSRDPHPPSGEFLC